MFGDDRSQGADLGWLWIGEQRWPGWRLDVVTVPETELGPPHPGGSTTLEPWTPEDPRQPIVGSGFAEVRYLTAQADPRVVLAGARADLVVVGATGRGFLKRRLHIGSTTEWLLHEPPAPLVIARSGRRVRRVLVGVDGSPPSQRALGAFAGLPWATDTEVLVVGARDGWLEPGPALDAASAVLEQAGIPHRIEEVKGRATEVLLRTQQREGSNLVVVGARGSSRLRHAVAGATASSVARAAESSVLLAA
ncbi:MAG TPA: universal stress protein [Acidimicrobiales bacterium]|nr:universal stress protein [Acidimicrobiales bacterium]